MTHRPAEDTIFLLIRHGETEWNAADLWQGHGDSPLTDRGREQAQRLAEQLADTQIDRLVTSDLGRCRATAAPLAQQLGFEPELRPELRELDVGSWSGLSRADIVLFEAETLRRFDAFEDVRPGGGEKRSELAVRVRGAVEVLATESPGVCIAVLTHGGVVRALTGTRAANTQAVRISLAEIRMTAQI